MGHQLHVQQHTLQHILEQRDILTIHYQVIELQVVHTLVRHMAPYHIKPLLRAGTPLRDGRHQVRAQVQHGPVAQKPFIVVRHTMQFGQSLLMLEKRQAL